MTRDPLVGGPARDLDDLHVGDGSAGTRPLPVAAAEPVFVDATGGRARLGRRLGLAAGAVLVVFTGALGLGLATEPNVPLTPWNDPSPRPSVKSSRPDGPTVGADERRAGVVGRPGRVTPVAPGSSAAVLPTRRAPAVSASTSRPGKSNATPPAWGRKKKNR
ncbi:hypothetical protein BZB76_0861 [Actinomadura pelletieri DSM 43383]|uniref:Uncharacterized protein n=1 Tax=Actinomadura pelletieri DSM 43383 TaxID=1120940 RepID=A0A495QZW5_9ACTN|nr:hypothetical protein [Actinomadura pelletieri]RKS79396.1 hypothetical protein BZB76_0861 [Actinomadura pelletieri DSM 43383]